MEKQLGGNYDHATDRPAVRTLEGLGHSADGVRLVDLVRPSSNRAQISAGAGLYAIYETGGAEEPVYSQAQPG
ncbi:MAG: hypothetical protein JNM72_23780 [Deltaproteobacteria bacterium]|nr:hypothetical protein [Deltaproteobacteria bacterium]